MSICSRLRRRLARRRLRPLSCPRGASKAARQENENLRARGFFAREASRHDYRFGAIERASFRSDAMRLVVVAVSGF